jgi:antitoxin (DNA-binding transcriptional repressor) of toxin-antitoxin stability system
MTMNMVKNIVMIRLNIAEAKAQLSRHIERVEKGETILLCRRNVPVAEIRSLSPRRTEPRPVGIDRGMVIPESFFEPLPEDILEVFFGEGGK